jgi:hypothetical protein
MRIRTTLLIPILGLLSWANAQEVMVIDLPRATAASATIPEDDQCEDLNFSQSCGAVIPKERESLTLRITRIDKTRFALNQGVVVDIQLKNEGKGDIDIPVGEQSTQRDFDGQRSSHASASLDLELETGSAGQSNRLAGDINLVGAKNVAMSFVRLSPGQWITLRVHKEIRCEGEQCSRIEPDDEAQLRATWSEYLYTEKKVGCRKDLGAFSVRSLKSKPIRVAIVADEKQSVPGGQ